MHWDRGDAGELVLPQLIEYSAVTREHVAGAENAKTNGAWEGITGTFCDRNRPQPKSEGERPRLKGRIQEMTTRRDFQRAEPPLRLGRVGRPWRLPTNCCHFRGEIGQGRATLFAFALGNRVAAPRAIRRADMKRHGFVGKAKTSVAASLGPVAAAQLNFLCRSRRFPMYSSLATRRWPGDCGPDPGGWRGESGLAGHCGRSG